MQFTKRLRGGIRTGRIRCSVRVWTSPHVRAGGRYPMDEGQVVVDSIVPIRLEDITPDLARESGFSSVDDLLETAKHGRGDNVYLIRFHYIAPGAWDVQRDESAFGNERRDESVRSAPVNRQSTLLQRIRTSKPTPRRRGRGRRAGG